MATNPTAKIWCDEDTHWKYEDFQDFNEWFDGEDGADLRVDARVEGLAQPSKAFFAGDREAYNATLEGNSVGRREDALGKEFLAQICGDDHWFSRNANRFDQLCNRLEQGEVVPFIGAGISQPGGFPTWKDHLRQQWRTAALDPAQVNQMIDDGQYEDIVDQIEVARSRDVFQQELRDAFDRNGVIPEALYLIAELFRDTVITTNYDRLIEQAYDDGGETAVEIIEPAQILNAPDPQKISVIKLHGDIQRPVGCVLSKSQYDAVYGAAAIDVALPIPQILDRYFRNISLLFLGCSLNQDRTVRVFEAIKAAIADGAENLPQHFSIEQCPADETELGARNDYLLRLGITPIWFEAGQFGFVEDILRLARNELRYRRR